MQSEQNPWKKQHLCRANKISGKTTLLGAEQTKSLEKQHFWVQSDQIPGKTLLGAERTKSLEKTELWVLSEPNPWGSSFILLRSIQVKFRRELFIYAVTVCKLSGINFVNRYSLRTFSELILYKFSARRYFFVKGWFSRMCPLPCFWKVVPFLVPSFGFLVSSLRFIPSCRCWVSLHGTSSKLPLWKPPFFEASIQHQFAKWHQFSPPPRNLLSWLRRG